jgi:hypothetical protein
MYRAGILASFASLRHENLAWNEKKPKKLRLFCA